MDESVRFRHQQALSLPLPTHRRSPAPPVQHRFGPESPQDAEVRVARLAEVKRLFRENWESYRRFSWKKDALLPISGWAATLVDNLDTLWIMGLRDEFAEAQSAVAEIDFGTSTSPRVNIFETNIRYLSGLLSAYDLSGRDVLLRKATELGDLIYAGFNINNGMPVDFIHFDSAKMGDGLVVENKVVSASPGTLSLEMTRLSQVTSDPKYYSAISKVMDLFYRAKKRPSCPASDQSWCR